MVRAYFRAAFAEFLASEREGIINRVAERHLCGRFGYLLERLKGEYGFGDYYADPEYDRKNGAELKTIIDGKARVIRIIADLIVHGRGKLGNRDNLIAIEMKKSGRPQTETQSDRERLMAMTKVPNKEVWSVDGKTRPEHVSGYELGVFIELNAAKTTVTVEEFESGKSIEVWHSTL